MLWLHSGTQMCSKSQITISQPSKTKAANWVETKQISKLKHFSSCRKITQILVLCLPVAISALSHGPAVLFLFYGLRAQAHGVGNTTILWLEVENSSHFLGDMKRLWLLGTMVPKETALKSCFHWYWSNFLFQAMKEGTMVSSPLFLELPVHNLFNCCSLVFHLKAQWGFHYTDRETE